MTAPPISIELAECLRYADLAVGEASMADWPVRPEQPALLVAEGFEERSLGILAHLAERRVRLPAIFIGRYRKDAELNARHRARFEALAEALAPGGWHVLENADDGTWVREALSRADGTRVAVDITGLSCRGLFGALDEIAAAPHDVTIMYSEAAEYAPTQAEWERIRRASLPENADHDQVADLADEGQWLYSGRHFHVELIRGHEGYDVAGTSALVAFLPFKAARLAAVINHAEYSQYLFIAGRPRLAENQWRLEALREFNRAVTKEWPTEVMSTFDYRAGVREVAELLFSPDSLSTRCDIHVAPMGSKLQTLACWAVSRITRSLTMVTSVPACYFPAAYSEGVGESWFFPFLRPRNV
jgi:hypothetical protein